MGSIYGTEGRSVVWKMCARDGLKVGRKRRRNKLVLGSIKKEKVIDLKNYIDPPLV